MKFLKLVLLALLFASGTALADSTQDHTCQGGHNCNTGSGDGSTPSTVINTNGNSNTNRNDNSNTVVGVNRNRNDNTAIGVGGQGGNSYSDATSVAFGGTTTSVSNSTGGQSSSNATGGTSSVGNTTSSSSSNGGSVNASGNTVGNGGGATVVVDNGTRVAAAQAGTAATVISGNDQCRVGTSLGGQAMSFGFVIGANTADEVCERIKLARELSLMGLKSAALALLAQDGRVRQALESVANGELFAK